MTSYGAYSRAPSQATAHQTSQRSRKLTFEDCLHQASLSEASQYSNIARFGAEINADNADPTVFYPARVLEKARATRRLQREDSFAEETVKQNVSMTLVLGRPAVVEHPPHCDSRCFKNERRMEMEGLSQAQVMERARLDPYFVRRQLSQQKFPS